MLPELDPEKGFGKGLRAPILKIDEIRGHGFLIFPLTKPNDQIVHCFEHIDP